MLSDSGQDLVMDVSTPTLEPSSEDTSTSVDPREMLDDSHVRFLFKTGNYILLYVTPLLIFSGTIGNLLSIATLQSKSFRRSASSFVMSALAITDITVLNTAALYRWLAVVAKVNIRLHHESVCKAHRYLTYLSLELSAWTLVLITAERVVAVFWPLRAASLCSKGRVMLAWILLLALLASANMFIPTESRIIRKEFVVTNGDNTSVTVPSVDCGIEDSLNKYLHWSHLCLGTLVPSGFIFLGNSAIVYRLAEQRIKRNQMTGHNPVSKTSSVTIMLLSISAVFLLTTLPGNVFFVVADDLFSMRTLDSLARRYLAQAAVSMLIFSNSSINFLFYFATGSKFREAFLEMFCCRKGVVSGTGH